MNGGVKQLLVMASFAAAGCAAAPDQVEVRPIGGPGTKLRAADDPLAAAKGQFAIGNVGLALEGFRKAARENPNSAEALAGMAACYETMGRDDLAEAKYEAALALAPRNATLLARWPRSSTGSGGATTRPGFAPRSRSSIPPRSRSIRLRRATSRRRQAASPRRRSSSRCRHRSWPRPRRLRFTTDAGPSGCARPTSLQAKSRSAPILRRRPSRSR